MKFQILSVALIFILLNVSNCSNLFFQWRITDTEKKQLEKETFELIKSNVELSQKLFSNYKTKAQILNEEPELKLSRYTHCQKCLTFARQFKAIKEKYGFDVTDIPIVLKLIDEKKLNIKNDYLYIYNNYIYQENDILVEFLDIDYEIVKNNI